MDENDSETCPVCLARFSRPYCLPCGHTYCADCIEALVTVRPSTTGRVRDRYVACPECRNQCKVSQAVKNVALSRALENGNRMQRSSPAKINRMRTQHPVAN